MHTKSAKKVGHLPVDIFLLIVDQMTVHTVYHIVRGVAQAPGDIHDGDAQRNHDRGVVVPEIVETEVLDGELLLQTLKAVGDAVGVACDNSVTGRSREAIYPGG